MAIVARTGKAQGVAADLSSRITSGAYASGTLLPAERALAEDYGVARNTVRAALNVLERDGLIRHEGGRGAVVCAPPNNGTPATFLLILPAPEDCPTNALSPEATALIGQTLCACRGSATQFLLQSMPADGRELVRSVRTVQAAGVLLIECHSTDMLGALQAEGIPHVVVNQEHNVPGPATRVDFWRIGREAASYLLGLGHRRLGVLCGPRERDMYEQMLAGLRGRCAEVEVYLAPDSVARVRSCSEASRAAALAMLDRPDRPTALFCARDIRAYGAYLAARELGLRVPEDLSLVGYDGITWPGEGQQFLTTFPEPAGELGGAALRLLASWLKTGQMPDDAVIYPELVVRGSTGPVGPRCVKAAP